MGRRRMILSLDEELHAILMELSKETGTPAASFVVELLESSKADIVRIIEAVKVAKRNPAIALESLNKMVEGATSNISKLQSQLNEEAKEVIGKGDPEKKQG